jgi:hypothetical protein
VQLSGNAVQPATHAPIPSAPVNSDVGPDRDLVALCANINPGTELLALAYPEFSIGQSSRGRHGPAWTIIRKDPAQPGLYAAVTPDLDELRDILARHAAQQPDRRGPEPDQRHETANAPLPDHEGPSHA